MLLDGVASWCSGLGWSTTSSRCATGCGRRRQVRHDAHRACIAPLPAPSRPLSRPQLLSQPLSQPVSQPVSWSFARSLSWPLFQPLPRPVSRPLSRPVSQPVFLPLSLPLSWSLSSFHMPLVYLVGSIRRRLGVAAQVRAAAGPRPATAGASRALSCSWRYGGPSPRTADIAAARPDLSVRELRHGTATLTLESALHAEIPDVTDQDMVSHAFPCLPRRVLQSPPIAANRRQSPLLTLRLRAATDGDGRAPATCDVGVVVWRRRAGAGRARAAVHARPRVCQDVVGPVSAQPWPAIRPGCTRLMPRASTFVAQCRSRFARWHRARTRSSLDDVHHGDRDDARPRRGV